MMSGEDEAAALAHQAELERRRWQDLLASDSDWVAWSQNLRDEAEKQQEQPP